MQKITTCLWFDHQAEEAVRFYTSLFPDSEILDVARYTEAGPGEPGSVMMIRFRIAGQELVALNGGPHFTFSEAISLIVECRDQAEIDRLWDALGAGGEYQMCGWLKDRYGLSWQLSSPEMWELLQGDSERTRRVMSEVLTMRKIDLQRLRAAAQGMTA